MINGHALVISLMATALISSRVSRLFAPPLYEALAARYMAPLSQAAPAPTPEMPDVEPADPTAVQVDGEPSAEDASGSAPQVDAPAPVVERADSEPPAEHASGSAPQVDAPAPVVERAESETPAEHASGSAPQVNAPGPAAGRADGEPPAEDTDRGTSRQ
jgi:hypothetical protein